MGQFQLRVKVIDRKEKEMCIFTEKFDGAKTTVGDLFKMIQKESKSSFLRNLDINRIRMTLGQARGRALSDKRMPLGKFFTPEEIKAGSVVLVFKDLGL